MTDNHPPGYSPRATDNPLPARWKCTWCANETTDKAPDNRCQAMDIQARRCPGYVREFSMHEYYPEPEL